MPKNPPSNAPEFLEHLETSPIEISVTAPILAILYDESLRRWIFWIFQLSKLYQQNPKMKSTKSIVYADAGEAFVSTKEICTNKLNEQSAIVHQ